MANIHPTVMLVLTPLLQSGLANLAQAAIDRLQAAEDSAATSPEDRDPFAPIEDEDTRRKGFRQLALVDDVISGRLITEQAMAEQTQQLIQSLGLNGVQIIGPEPEASAHKTIGGQTGDFASGRRRFVIDRCLNAWTQGVAIARERLETDGDL